MKGNISWIFKFMRRYRLKMLISGLFAIISGACALAAPLFMGKAIDALSGETVDNSALGKYLVILAAIYLAGGILSWLSPVISGKIAALTAGDMRKGAFRRLQKLPLRYFDTHPHGDLIARLTADCDNIYEGLSQSFVQLATGIVTIIGTLVAMFIISPAIAAVVLCITPLSVVIARFVVYRTAKLFAAQQKLTGELNGCAEEMLSGLSCLHSYSMEQDAYGKFTEINSRLYKTGRSAQFGGALINPSTRLVNNLSYISVGLIGSIFAVKGITAGGWAMTVGTIATLLSYATQFAKPINELAGVTTQIQNGLASAGRLRELEAEEPESDDSELPVLTSVSVGDRQGTVDFENVAFSYVPERPLITNLSLHAKKGGIVAIVGPTGGGKTTLVNLLMRFYDPDSGTICVDGTDTLNVTRDSLRDNFSMVLQDTWLFTGTVRENIAYGRPGATDEEIIAASKAAYAHNFIKRLPKGYDTVITDGGSNLSLGQCQLLTIARAMLSDAPVLILDEATSSVDIVTEQYIQRGFATLMAGRTSFIIAHRLATIRSADLILVMVNGHIAEQGNHEELMAKRGKYYELTVNS